MTKIKCGALACINNNGVTCSLSEITLYTGSLIRCPVCDEENKHDLVDCGSYRRDVAKFGEVVECF